MKTSFLFSFIFSAILVQAQWFELESGTSEHLSDVYFINENTGFTISSIGSIFKTNDGGENWSQQYSIDSTNYDGLTLEGIYFLNETTGFAVGSAHTNWPNSHGYSVLLRTTDTGETWVNINNSIDWQGTTTHGEQFSDTLTSFYGINFFDNLHGYICGSSENLNAIILETTDGGENWTFLIDVYNNNPLASYLIDISVFDSEHGAAIGLGGSFFNFNGTTWECLNIGEIGMVEESVSVDFVDQNIFFIQYGEQIYKVVYGVWEEQTTNTSSGLTSIDFISPNFGYCTGPPLLRTTNGGLNWEVIESPLYYLNSVFLVNSNVGYAVGGNGNIVKTINADYNVEFSQSIIQNITTVSPNPFNNKIVVSSTNIENVKIKIFDVTGCLILITETNLSEEVLIDLFYLNSGMYFLKIETEKYSEIHKIIKN